jgi:hypothetical protein
VAEWRECDVSERKRFDSQDRRSATRVEHWRRVGRALEIAKERPHRPGLADRLSLVEAALAARPIADYEGPPTQRYSSAFQSAGESGA